MWVLTRAINEYDQDGEYFVTVWINKPNYTDLDRFFKTKLEQSFLDHLYNGGGRIEYEDEWYFLREIQSGEQIEHTNKL